METHVLMLAIPLMVILIAIVALQLITGVTLSITHKEWAIVLAQFMVTLTDIAIIGYAVTIFGIAVNMD